MADDNLKARKEALERYIKDAKSGLLLADEHIDLDPSDLRNNALLGRNLAGDALAHEVLKNTGLSVPDKRASKSQVESFLNKLAADEMRIKDPNIRLGDESAYFYNDGKILVDKNKDRIRNVSDMLHEGGHKLDDLNQGYRSVDLPTGKEASQLLDNAGDSLGNYDKLATQGKKGSHHLLTADRPKSFELSNLTRKMKGLDGIKQIAGPAASLGLGLATALATGDAMAAVPVLGDSDPVGEEDDVLHQERAYQVSPAGKDATEARKQALKKLSN